MKRSMLLIVVTVGFGLLYLAAAIALGTTPEPGDDGQTVAAWFRDHDGNVRAWIWLLTLSAPLFATFAAETAVQGWIWGGMAWHAGDLQPATARTLLDVASFWGPVLTSTTVTM